MRPPNDAERGWLRNRFNEFQTHSSRVRRIREAEEGAASRRRSGKKRGRESSQPRLAARSAPRCPARPDSRCKPDDSCRRNRRRMPHARPEQVVPARIRDGAWTCRQAARPPDGRNPVEPASPSKPPARCRRTAAATATSVRQRIFWTCSTWGQLGKLDGFCQIKHDSLSKTTLTGQHINPKPLPAATPGRSHRSRNRAIA